MPPASGRRWIPACAALPRRAARSLLGAYLSAHAQRAELDLHMRHFHERYDLLLTPQMPLTALEAGCVTPADGRFGEEWINWSPYTYPFNLTQPAGGSVPCGFASDGLPVTLQIVGPAAPG